MLKKVICLLLVLACSAALFACGGAAPDDNNSFVNNEGEGADKNKNPGDKEFIDDKSEIEESNDQAFFALINSSRPNRITTQTTVTNPKLGSCTGFFDTKIISESEYELYYQYEKFNRIGEGTGLKTLVGPHTIYYNDGQYSLDTKDNWVLEHPDSEVLNVKLDLSRQNLEGYTLSSDGRQLVANVSAESAENILGIDVGDASTVEITVISDGTHLWKVNIKYSDGTNNIYIETSYTYEPVSAE